MADTTGKDTAPTDPKAKTASGPVKPPVLEGTARASSASKPAAGATASASKTETARPEPTGAAPSSGSNEPERKVGQSWIAGLLGGAIGLGAAYGLAWFGLWPSAPQTLPPADPRLTQISAAIPELQTVTNTLQSELSTLTGRVAGLQNSLDTLPTPGSQASDPALAEQVAALAARLETLATTLAPAGSTEAATQNIEALSALEQQMAQLQQEVTQSTARLSETESRLSALSETTSAHQIAGNQTAQLPLIFSGLESAFASGRAYDDELAALRHSWPDVVIPNAIAAHASTGLPDSEALARRLSAVIPDILAARPIAAGATWQDGAMDWVRGIVAMRPTEAIEGNSPEAQASRLETAVARRDFRAAAAALGTLPPAMLAATGNIGDDLELLASAQAFLADLRQTALMSGGQK